MTCGLTNAAFTMEAVTHNGGLTEEQVEHFEERGWVGPFSLLTPQGVWELGEVYRQSADRFVWTGLQLLASDPHAFEVRPWFKSMHIYVPAFRASVAHHSVVSRVSSLLGPDVLAWGATTTVRRPGQIHRWHVDVEHIRLPGVTVFIGLQHTTPESSLQLIECSHHINAIPQTLGIRSDKEALAASKALEPRSRLVTVAMSQGEFFIFDGRVWHGSHNTGPDTRLAIVAQYSRPDADVAIPLTFDEPLHWHSYRPPCLLVSGIDQFGVNRIISPLGTMDPVCRRSAC
jgi:phytanoyl-CoA dioxygenase PhyH